MRRINYQRSKKCTPGGVYLLHIMGRSIRQIAAEYGRPAAEIMLYLDIARTRPDTFRHKKRCGTPQD